MPFKVTETYIQASRSNIRGNQDSLFGVDEFEERVSPLLLFLFAMQVKYGEIAVDVPASAIVPYVKPRSCCRT